MAMNFDECLTRGTPYQWYIFHSPSVSVNEDQGSEVVNSMLERRAPMLLRLAMLFALTDLQTRVDVPHIDAAMAWIQYITASEPATSM